MRRDLTILLAGKAAYRARLAALPVVEKLRLLEALRERAVALRAAAPPAASTPPAAVTTGPRAVREG